ncbi:MAG: hypothetical protein HYW25_03015 [Candidatus Aenigmarchaeota archaeon]|nr:hypothetical protein [Candidatus Aenigmarchaeota archaeon]
MAMNGSKVLLAAVPPLESDRHGCYSKLSTGLRIYEGSIDAIHVTDVRVEDDVKRKRDSPRVPQMEFARQVREWVPDKNLILYRVVVHEGRDGHLKWMEEARALGVNTIVLVGGDRSDKTYQGLDLSQASELARQEGFDYGGIIIPTRRSDPALVPEEILRRRVRPARVDEVDRVRKKIGYGLSGFFTQILYESEGINRLLTDLVNAGVRVPRLFLSFSPAMSAEDIDFHAKLGAYVPEGVRRQLEGAWKMDKASAVLAVELWRDVSEHCRNLGLPEDVLGVNVEYVNIRTMERTMKMIDEFGRWVRPRRRENVSNMPAEVRKNPEDPYALSL